MILLRRRMVPKHLTYFHQGEVWKQDFAPSLFLHLIDHVTSRSSHTHSFHWITSGDISIDIHETFMKYKELSESYYFQMLFLHSDPISILSPGFVELPDPSLQKQMHLQWPDDFSSFWRWKPNAPSPGLRQRHAWTFRNSRSAKPDLKCPGRIWHFMILDSCLSVQSQPFGDFRNHLFKKT